MIFLVVNEGKTLLTRAMFTDCHSHLSFYDDEKIEPLLADGKSRGLRHWCLGGYDAFDWQRQKALSTRFPGCFSLSFGLHPWKVIDGTEEECLVQIQQLKIELQNVNFLGEMGLDFYRPQGKALQVQQEFFFREQLRMAQNIPVVLHVVQANSQALSILDEFPKCYGLVHGFGRDLETAQKYIQRNFLISIGRQILNSKNKKLQEVARALPLDVLLIESDSPSSPTDFSDPVDSFFSVASTVATLRGISVETLLASSTMNLNRLQNET